MTTRACTSALSIIAFSDATSGTGEYAGYLSYYHSTDELHIGALAKPIVKIHDEYFNIYANEGTTRMNFGFTDTNGGELSIYDDTGAQKTRICGSTNTDHFLNNGGNFIVGGTSLGAADSFGVQPSGHFRCIGASGSTGDTLIGAIDGVSNGFQTNISGTNVQMYRFHNGSTVTAQIDSDGLKFMNDTAAANALNDYEEGTFTPTQPTIGTNSASGHYTKIGRYVYASIFMTLPTNSSDVAFYIDDLPFTALNNSGTNIHGGYAIYSTYGNPITVRVHDNATRAQVSAIGGGNITLNPLDNINFRLQVHYMTN